MQCPPSRHLLRLQNRLPRVGVIPSTIRIGSSQSARIHFYRQPASADSLAQWQLNGVNFVGVTGEGTPMHVLRQLLRSSIIATLVCLICARVTRAADEPNLTKEQITNFLLTAKVVDSKPAAKGITNTW